MIVNYDGTIATSPKQIVYPETVEDIQAVLRDIGRYPSPVRAMGSNHSLTPCAASEGTILNMRRMDKLIRIDEANHTFTAQAGLQVIDASKALRSRNLQLMLNVDIGNMTLGSAACCHSKDALDGAEFGQFTSYLKGIKWVTPSGDLAEASETDNPALLRMVRSSYGLCGVIYEVTFRVKPIEVLHFTYEPRSVDDLTQEEVDDILDHSEGLLCWTIGRTCTFQRRHRIEHSTLLSPIQAAVRRKLWNFQSAYGGRLIDKWIPRGPLRHAALESLGFAANTFFRSLHLFGGINILAPDKTVDYRRTRPSARYAFTFWAFPRNQWLETLRAYLDFSERHFKATGFICNMPLGSYYIRRDTSSILSYTHDGEIVSIDPIHAITDVGAWQNFLREFNEFSYQRNGIPLLNQSPLVERKHVEAGFGRRWIEFCEWVRTVDPHGRMLNPFFAELFSGKAGMSASAGLR